MFVFGLPNMDYGIRIEGPYTVERTGTLDKNGQDYLVFYLYHPGDYSADLIYNKETVDTTFFQILKQETEINETDEEEDFEEEDFGELANYLEKPEIFSNLLMSLDLPSLSRLGEVSRQSLFERLTSPLFQNNYIAKLKCVRLLEQLINLLPEIYSPTPLQKALAGENDAYIREYLEKILMKLHEFLSTN